MSTPTVLSRKPVCSYLPHEPEIAAVTFEDGKHLFFPHYNHYENLCVPVHELELEEVVHNWIYQLTGLVRVLHGDGYSAVADSLDTVLQAFDRHMAEAFQAVHKEIGVVSCVMASANTTGTREGRVVAVDLVPAEKACVGKDRSNVVPIKKGEGN